MILNLNSEEVKDKAAIVEQTYNNWKKETQQIDDVLLMGVKLYLN